MNIEFDEKDKRFIDNINKDIESGDISMTPLLINKTGETYYLEFTCTDIAKANAFAMHFMHQCHTHEELGIEVKSFNYCHGDRKLHELKEYLRNVILELENMQ